MPQLNVGIVLKKMHAIILKVKSVSVKAQTATNFKTENVFVQNKKKIVRLNKLRVVNLKKMEIRKAVNTYGEYNFFTFVARFCIEFDFFARNE